MSVRSRAESKMDIDGDDAYASEDDYQESPEDQGHSFTAGIPDKIGNTPFQLRVPAPEPARHLGHKHPQNVGYIYSNEINETHYVVPVDLSIFPHLLPANAFMWGLREVDADNVFPFPTDRGKTVMSSINLGTRYLECNGHEAVIIDGLVDAETGEFVVGTCWRCVNSKRGGGKICEVVGARIPLCKTYGDYISCVPKQVPNKARSAARNAYVAEKKKHIARVLNAQRAKVDEQDAKNKRLRIGGEKHKNSFGRDIKVEWRRQKSEYLMPGDIYVNEPMPLSKLFKARKPEPKPRPEPPAATITGVRSTPMPEPKQQAQETTTGAPRAAETAAPVRRAADAQRDVIVEKQTARHPSLANRVWDEETTAGKAVAPSTSSNAPKLQSAQQTPQQGHQRDQSMSPTMAAYTRAGRYAPYPPSPPRIYPTHDLTTVDDDGNAPSDEGKGKGKDNSSAGPSSVAGRYTGRDAPTHFVGHEF